MKNIQAVLLGCGMVGGSVVSASCSRGVDYIAGFDINDALIGKSLNDVYHIEGAKGEIYPVSELENFIRSHTPDICISTPTGPLSRTLSETSFLLSNGVNVLTSLADIYSSKMLTPDLYTKLDACAKKGNSTFLASGIQDVFWTALPRALTGCSLDIQEIRGYNYALIDSFGTAVADEVCVGMDPVEYMKSASGTGDIASDDFLIALYELAGSLGLHPVHAESSSKPIIAEKDYYFPTIQRHVARGMMVGNIKTSTLQTEEGIPLKCDFYSKMTTGDNDSDKNGWEIKGTPDINICTDHMQGEITTGSNMVNRIPDVINAPSGVITAGSMPAPYWKHGALNRYITDSNR